MRLRITFAKTEAMRYTGHLDLHRAWERIFRRARLPLAYSQGFHPQPRLNLACALPLGFTSECELLDAWLETELPIDEVEQALIPSLPPGIQIQDIQVVDQRLPALQTQVRSADYCITLLEPPSEVNERIDRIVNSESLPRVRRNKAYDLRPLIEYLQLVNNTEDQPRLALRMSAREAATGRPEELLAELGIPFEKTRVHRTKLIFGGDSE
jgi:radical SAM-linked protein